MDSGQWIHCELTSAYFLCRVDNDLGWGHSLGLPLLEYYPLTGLVLTSVTRGCSHGCQLLVGALMIWHILILAPSSRTHVGGSGHEWRRHLWCFEKVIKKLAWCLKVQAGRGRQLRHLVEREGD